MHRPLDLSEVDHTVILTVILDSTVNTNYRLIQLNVCSNKEYTLIQHFVKRGRRKSIEVRFYSHYLGKSIISRFFNPQYPINFFLVTAVESDSIFNLFLKLQK